MSQLTKEFIDVTARASNPVSFKNLSYYGATSVKKGGVFCFICVNYTTGKEIFPCAWLSIHLKSYSTQSS